MYQALLKSFHPIMARPKKYETEEERQAARRATFKKSSKAYVGRLAPDFVRRAHIIPKDVAARLDAYCSSGDRNSSDVVTAALKAYFRQKS